MLADLFRLGLILALVRSLHDKVDRYMSSISADLAEIKSNLEEAATEIVEKLGSLDVVSDEDKATIADLKVRAQALADIVPDEEPDEEPDSDPDPKPEPELA